MKTTLLTALQFFLFLVVFGAGSFFPPFHFEHILFAAPGTTRVFIADGLLLMFALFLIILLIEALRKRILISGRWTTVAFILATAIGLWMEFGFKTLTR